LPLLLPALLWQVPRPAPGQFDVLAADVGQGQAVLVRTAGHSLLYDAGPRFASGDAGERVLVPLLYALGERLDMLVLSHGDEDHTGGAPAVLARQAQARVLGSLQPGHPVRGLRPVTACSAGQAWDWDGVRFTVLHPPPAGQGAAARAQPGSNGRSCVLRIEAPGRAGAPGAAAILAGDLERAQEQELVAAAAPLRADLLLVPHHGSKTSSSAAFIDAVQPHLALVQAGYRNRFGHPAPAVAARYRERGIPLVATPQCGAAQWSSAAARQWRCWRESAPHYWQYAGR
jgi:competence protein ComEC